MKMLAAFLLLLVCGMWQQLHAASILCLVGTSQNNNPTWSEPFFEALAGRGHSLTVIGTLGTSPISRINHIPMVNNYDVVKKHYVDAKGHYYRYWDIKQVLIWYEALLGNCRTMIETDVFKDLDKINFDYDLIIVDMAFSMDCLLTKVPKLLDVPIMALSGGKLTTDVMNLVHAEDTISPVTVPHFVSQLPLEMSYLQRIQNHLLYLTETFILSSTVKPVLNGMLLSGFFTPEVQVVLLNTHPVLDYVQNMPPNVIQVGGLHIRAESEPLPFSMQEFIERFSEGIVYINLPHIELMYGLGLHAIESMVREFPQFGFLWNVKGLKESQLSENFYNLRTIEVVDNMQQNIMAQSHVKVFVTHGDSFGLQEAIFNAVPVIVLPLLMDQINNAQRVLERNLGVRVNSHKFGVDSFSAALKQIIREELYFDTLRQAQINFRTRQLKPVDVAIWYAEQLVTQPDLFKHLTAPKSVDHFYFVKQSLDILILPLLFILCLITSLILTIWETRVARKKKMQQAKEIESKKGKGKSQSADKHKKDD